MATFQNTKVSNTINSLTEGYKNILKNPYYNLTNKKPFLVTYYNKNINKTTLDDSLKIDYAPLGNNSPIRYNKIIDAYLFGTNRLELNLDASDWGTESIAIESESIVVPNSWTPYPDDYFCINHSGKDYLFRVTEVEMDTLENGANFYKIAWKYDRPDTSEIDNLVVENYRMLINNIGTSFDVVIRSETYDLIHELEILSSRLKTYYNDIFYRDAIQTYIYNYNGFNMYDPYMIEFIKHNSIMSGSDKYIFVDHQTYVGPAFGLVYDKLFFKALENKNINKLGTDSSGAVMIQDPSTLFASRFENYYEVDYLSASPYKTPIDTIDDKLISNIQSNTQYTDANTKYLNTIIRYFNNGEITRDIVESFDNVDFSDNVTLFYTIPACIFIIDGYIKNLLSRTLN